MHALYAPGAKADAIARKAVAAASSLDIYCGGDVNIATIRARSSAATLPNPHRDQRFLTHQPRTELFRQSAGVASLPFGGTGDSGFGRIHGADGLREFARAKSISRQRFAVPGMRLTSFSRQPEELERLIRLVTFLHGRRKR